MTTGSLPASGVAVPQREAPGPVVIRLAARQVRRGALIVACTVAAMSAIVVAQYQTTFKNALDGSALRALAENPAIRVLFGPPVALDDPGGFTVWRTGTPVLVLAGVWILLAATGITRGEEDAGRWDLLLAGPLRKVDLVVRCLAVLCGCAVVISVAVAAGLLVTGTDAAGATVHGIGILGVTLTFATAGLLAAQLLPSRAAATAVSVALLGVFLLVRMAADGVPALAWASWTTPFGLTGLAAPYAHNRLAPLIVLAAYPALFAAAALLVAQRRDLGTGLVALRTSRSPRTRLLGSITGFALRRAIRPTSGWATALAAFFMLVGALIASILQFFDENPRFPELAAAAGFAGLDSANGFAAALFRLLAIPCALYAATRLAALADDERAHRWTLIYAAPISRTHLVCIEIAVVAGGVLLLHTAAGLALWTGAAISGAPLGLGSALAGALNAAPIAWLGLAAAAFALGWLPSAVAAIGALPVAGGFLLDIITQNAKAPRWLTDLSPFAHLAAVPDVPPDWLATGGLGLIAAVVIAVGVTGYSRRDLDT